MAVPKRKQNPSRTGMRRQQTMKYSTKNIVEDKSKDNFKTFLLVEEVKIISICKHLFEYNI